MTASRRSPTRRSSLRGRTLKLSDIAEVRRGYEDPATYIIRHQGEPTIMLAAVMQAGLEWP